MVELIVIKYTIQRVQDHNVMLYQTIVSNIVLRHHLLIVIHVIMYYHTNHLHSILLIVNQ